MAYQNYRANTTTQRLGRHSRLYTVPVLCVPYFVNFFKDTAHLCGRCGHLLATYHGRGHVVVHQQQRRQGR
ncbi:uncharacterized protein BDV17DRAFT_263558 [Aspergillus undulatus]|uniref:uncharacterized protein n=1 Tax=Aspergillus undulatus TaxID=1810928 RepID=UPI003CCCCEF3